MSDKKSILLVTTQYRAGERIYPIIPHLAKEYNIDLIKLYQRHPKAKSFKLCFKINNLGG